VQINAIKDIALVAVAGVVIPLTLAALALVVVSVTSMVMPDARRQHALQVLDRLAAFATAVRGGPDRGGGGGAAQAEDGPSP
jgi:hypothetical protein